MLDKTSKAIFCFHCGDTVPTNSNWHVTWKNIERPMCCPGCEAVCETIISSGLEEYYLHRIQNPTKPKALIADEIKRILAFNQPEISNVFTEIDGEKQQATFYIDGMTCAACAWLIEKKVAALPFVEKVSINSISNLANIQWFKENHNSTDVNPPDSIENTHMGDILSVIRSSGYSAKPLLSEQLASEHKASQKDLLKRLGVAGLGMMQVMMFAVGLYSGAFQGIEEKYRLFLKLLSWFVATPVVFYAAAPFFRAAWNNLKSFELGMNVPVSIAIGSAYWASTYNTFSQQGEVYFDSAVMFTFFLLIGRFLQSRAGWRASESNLTSNLATAPTVQIQLDGQWQYQPSSQLKIDDIILIPAGETIAVDGIIETGSSQISTAIIDGEFEPRLFKSGDNVFAGSINQTQPIQVRCTGIGVDRYIEKLARRQQQALAEKPKIVSIADKISHWFVLFVISTATIAFIYWHLNSPENAFWITLSVLVVSCPCALSLATPAAITAAIARASKIGFLINKPELFEHLHRTKWVVFDKTGTLTEGNLNVTEVEIFDQNFTKAEILSICVALEMTSSHPIADAIRQSSPQIYQEQQIKKRREIPGKGVAATIQDVDYRLGNFTSDADENVQIKKQKNINLYKNNSLIARIYLDDPYRKGAQKTLQQLSSLGYKIALLSGDPSLDKIQLKQYFSLDDILIAASAEDKLNWVKYQQQNNQSVIMVGDGVNDGPVLAQADVSIAMAQGAALSKTISDAVLLTGKLSNLLKLFQLSQQTRSVIWQNLSWAIAYNIVTIPLASAGFIQPWIAAIGMSFSSLFVVLNALRLNRNSEN